MLYVIQTYNSMIIWKRKITNMYGKTLNVTTIVIILLLELSVYCDRILSRCPNCPLFIYTTQEKSGFGDMLHSIYFSITSSIIGNYSIYCIINCSIQHQSIIQNILHFLMVVSIVVHYLHIHIFIFRIIAYHILVVFLKALNGILEKYYHITILLSVVILLIKTCCQIMMTIWK